MASRVRPFSVALIGADGAGKTTIAKRLETSLVGMRVRYLYMGINREASNVKSPVESFIRMARTLRGHHTMGQQNTNGSESRLWWGWFAKQIAEEIYRQFLSWSYRRRGYTVIYDRHFRFDFSPVRPDLAKGIWDRLHRWFLARLYPRPDLVLFLDAPPEILFSRKHESTLERLQIRREAFLNAGKRTPNFFRIDASRPVDDVYDDVLMHVREFCRKNDLKVEDATASPRVPDVCRR